MGGSDVGVEWTSSIIIGCVCIVYMYIKSFVYCSLALDMPTFCLFPFSPPH